MREQIGPITFALSTSDLKVVRVDASQATSLCGRSSDWAEVLANERRSSRSAG